ncbi:alpha/beta hydrolase [Nocardia inohanensis]|uniref:alpha/beta hydrolase n=1 Tax=Nocardia inohanensis TaxID=209246 RepID=UPI00083534F0|nr:alpha/beta hydrolase family protein [Nocardia inohanensis]
MAGAALAAAAPLIGSIASPATARAAFNSDGFDFYVDSATMGPVKSRVFRAADGNTNRVLYALDGMRARDDLNGWEIETEVARELTKQNINVVMPVGGQSSFYTDWNAASTFLGSSAGTDAGRTNSGSSQVLAGGPGKSYAYKWETFLSKELPTGLRDRLGFSSTRNGVVGLSMSGSSALMLAAFYPGQFCYAGSFSGALNMSDSVMRNAVRVAMLDAGGFNVESMAKTTSQWQHLDAYSFAPKLKANGTRMWISAGSGLPTSSDALNMTTLQGMGIEAVALMGTRAFQSRYAGLGGSNVTYDFPGVGVHNWKNWEAQLYKMLPDLSANIG